MASRPTFAVLGAGWAGLSAAARLVDRGGRVILLERRQAPGGRAFSFTDPRSGEVLDNGPHLFLGCYSATLGFLDLIGARDRIRFEPRLRIPFRDPERGRSAFHCPRLPSPLHLLVGLLRHRGIPPADRFRALRVGSYLRRRRGSGFADLEDRTLADWLEERGQNAAVRRAVWDPIATAALNEEPEVASAAVFARVMEEAFLTGGNSAAGLGRFGLSDLYGGPAVRYLRERGGETWFGSRVRRIEVGPEGVRGLVLADGARIAADAYLSTLAPRELRAVLPAACFSADPYFGRILELESSPIVSVHLWYERPFLDESFVGMLGTRTQWLFDRWSILGDPRHGRPAGSGRRRDGAATGLSAVISAAHRYIDWPASAIIRMVREDIVRCFPEAATSRLLRATVVKERHATISPRTGTSRLRPGPRGPVPNLFLAGDWTDTGLPGCIEGAVRSGERAAGAAWNHLAGPDRRTGKGW